MKHLIKRRNLILALVAVILVGMGAVAMSGAGVITVEFEVVDRGPVSDIIEEEAQVTSRKSRNVSVLVNGTVEAWQKDIGDIVEVGDLLAIIEKTDVENEILTASEQLSALKFSFEDALEPNDRELIRQAEALYNAKMIARDSAKSTHNKNETLFAEGAISAQTLEDGKNALGLAQEDLNGQYQALIQLRKGLSEAMKNKFASEIKAKEASIQALDLKKARHEIRATENGVILNRMVEAGDYIIMGTVAFEIANTTDIYFKSDILDSDVQEIENGTSVIIHLNDDDTVMGHVSKVFPKAETQISDLGIEQKRVTIEIDSDEEMDRLLIGQELDVDYITESKTDVLRVREELTYQREGQHYVFIEVDGKAVERALETDLVGETYVEVISGLSEGDKIIIPQDALEPDAKVKHMEE